MENGTKRRRKGEGTIIEYESGKWLARIKINGKQFSFYGTSEKEATKKLNNFKNKIKAGQTDYKRMLYEDFLEFWLSTKRQNMKPKSYDRLESTVYTNIINKSDRKSGLGFYYLDNLEVEIIQKLLTDKSKTLAYSSVKKIYDALNASLKYARSMGKIISNPVDLIEKPKSTGIAFANKQKAEDNLEIFTDDEIQRFVTAANAKFENGKLIYKNAGIFILMLNTGLRVGEASALKWIDYDEKEKTIRVNSSIVQYKNDDGKQVIKEQKTVKTRNSERILNLNAKAIEALPPKHEWKYVFCNRRNENGISDDIGNPLKPRNIQRTLDYILERADIPHKSTHVFRHTFASKLFEKGVDVKIVSELLGHTDIRTTYNTYIT